ncbi:MAG: hypothetical protein BWY46_01299 [Firmicutes bacterium ADurb.Bin300]|nr:MAG: hypothetical protein BWY46_01299 [Firmicutes bacterium ADurb.Bin300]
MNTKIENRKIFMINFAYFTLFILLYYYFIKHALGYVFPFIFAAMVSAALQKPIRFLSNKLKVKKSSVIAAILVMLIFLFLLFLLVLAAVLIFGELKGFFSYLSSKLTSIPTYINQIEAWLLQMVNYLPLSMRSTLYQAITDFFNDNMSFDRISSGSFDFSIFLGPLEGAWSTAKRIPSILLASLVTIISCFFISVSYTNLRDSILALFSYETQKKILNIKSSLFSALTKMSRAYLLIMLITFIELLLGLNLLKLIGLYKGGYILVIALVTAIIDIVPVLGTGAVLITWSAISFFTGNIGLGIGLIVLYAAISVLRQIIEPKLVAGQVGLPAIITIMAMFVGAKLFGVFGIIILPLSVITLKLMYDEGVFAQEKT